MVLLPHFIFVKQHVNLYFQNWGKAGVIFSAIAASFNKSNQLGRFSALFELC